MLLELRIENLLLIERAELRLGPGLNAITGETGAGKTILAHSFDLLMGGRARSGIVRPGASEAYVEGVIELPEGLLDDPELAEIAERLPEGSTDLVIGRRVSATGRTSAFLGGRSAAAPDLQALGSRLLAFYGQHEHRKLTLARRQLETLDGFAGERHLERRRAYREAHAEVIRLERRARANRGARGSACARPRLAPLRARRDRRGRTRRRRGGRACDGARPAAARRGRCALPPPRRSRPFRATATGVERRRRWARPKRPSAPGRAWIPRSTGWPRRPGGCGWSSRSWRGSCAPTRRGSRASRSGSSRSRSGSRCSTG